MESEMTRSKKIHSEEPAQERDLDQTNRWKGFFKKLKNLIEEETGPMPGTVVEPADSEEDHAPPKRLSGYY